MIVIDVETSGLDPKENGLLSIGAVDFENPETKFYGECRLKEDAKIDPKALEVNGFTEEQIRQCARSCEDLLKEFLNWSTTIKDKTLEGHNLHFDISFLKENVKAAGLKWPFHFRCVDLHGVFYVYLLKKGETIPLKEGVSKLDLDFIIDYFKLEKRKGAHNALQDALLTREAFEKIVKS